MQKVTPGKRCGLTFQRLKVCFSPSIPYSVRLFALLCCYSSCPFISYFSLSFFCCREAFCGHPGASRLPPYSHRQKSAEERDRYVYCLGLFGDFFSQILSGVIGKFRVLLGKSRAVYNWNGKIIVDHPREGSGVP